MNIWIKTNSKRLERIKRQLIEYNYAGSYGGSINLMEVNNLIDGLMIEVTKIDNENSVLKQKLKELESKGK